MKKYKIQSVGMTDVGLKRTHNEDSILLADDLGLFAVADGMGGHAAGEVASRTAIKAIRESVRLDIQQDDEDIDPDGNHEEDLPEGERILVSSIRRANDMVCNLAEQNTHYFGMGTTVAVLYFLNDEAYIGHVGDSRIYRFSEGRLQSLTQDHSWVNEQLLRNIITEEEARNHRWRNVITRALGNRLEVEIDRMKIDAKEGDIYLICSDGLTSMLEDKEIEQSLIESHESLTHACEELVRLANEAGGQDNISVVLVRLVSVAEGPLSVADEATQSPPETADLHRPISAFDEI